MIFASLCCVEQRWWPWTVKMPSAALPGGCNL
jgi:hypothetical protein